MGLYWLAAAAVGVVVAGAAACWPYLPIRPESAKRTVDRADWVNRLFGLAAQADAETSPAVAAAARALIAALVAGPKEP